MSEVNPAPPAASEKGGNSTDERSRSTGDQNFMRLDHVPERRRLGTRLGLSAIAERRLSRVGIAVLVVLALGWGWSFAHSKDVAATADGEVSPLNAVGTITAALTNRDAPSTAYLTNAALDLLTERMLASQLGKSGKLRATFRTSGGVQLDTVPPGAQIKYAQNGDTTSHPTHSGVWSLLLAVGNAIRPVSDFSVITMLPFSAKQGGRIGSYLIGSWPSEKGAKGPAKAPPDRYANPAGFIEVTPEIRTPRSVSISSSETS